MSARTLQNSLRTRRLEHDPPLLQREVAAMLGVAQSLVSSYERGTVPRELRRAFELAIILKTPVEQLFHELYLDVSTDLAERMVS